MFTPVKRKWVLVTISITAPGTAQQLGSNFVPDGHHVNVTARLDNTQNMFIGTTKANAQTAANRKSLAPGQSVDLDIMDTNLIFVDAQNSTDVAEITLVSD